jgi:hypothetical protein
MGLISIPFRSAEREHNVDGAGKCRTAASGITDLATRFPLMAGEDDPDAVRGGSQERMHCGKGIACVVFRIPFETCELRQSVNNHEIRDRHFRTAEGYF